MTYERTDIFWHNITTKAGNQWIMEANQTQNEFEKETI